MAITLHQLIAPAAHLRLSGEWLAGKNYRTKKYTCNSIHHKFHADSLIQSIKCVQPNAWLIININSQQYVFTNLHSHYLFTCVPSDFIFLKCHYDYESQLHDIHKIADFFHNISISHETYIGNHLNMKTILFLQKDKGTNGVWDNVLLCKLCIPNRTLGYVVSIIWPL